VEFVEYLSLVALAAVYGGHAVQGTTCLYVCCSVWRRSLICVVSGVQKGRLVLLPMIVVVVRECRHPFTIWAIFHFLYFLYVSARVYTVYPCDCVDVARVTVC